MAQHTIYEQRIAYARETTVCEPPADPTTATAIEYISCDTAGIKQSLLVDPTAEARAFAVGTRKVIKSIRNCGASVVLKLHGTGVVTAATETVDQTYLGELLEHCMGGVHLGVSTTITGGTAVIPIVTAVTGIIPGAMVGFQDITSPSAENLGKVWARRVLAVDGDTKAVTLSEALPFTPAATDKVHAAITPYLRSTILVDAVASAGGPHTLCWYMIKGDASAPADLVWRVDGSVASMKLDGLGRGALPTLALDILGANFAHGAGDSLANVEFANEPQGHAQLSMGLDVTLSIQTYNTSAINELDASAVSFDPGFTRVPVISTTERIHRFEGLTTWSFVPGQTKFTCTVLPYEDTWYDQLAAGQLFRITLTQPGMGSGAGAGWCLHLPKVQLLTTPARVDADSAVHAITLEFLAMEPDDTTGGSNVDLQKSRFTLCLF